MHTCKKNRSDRLSMLACGVIMGLRPRPYGGHSVPTRLRACLESLAARIRSAAFPSLRTLTKRSGMRDRTASFASTRYVNTARSSAWARSAHRTGYASAAHLLRPSSHKKTAHMARFLVKRSSSVHRAQFIPITRSRPSRPVPVAAVRRLPGTRGPHRPFRSGPPSRGRR